MPKIIEEMVFACSKEKAYRKMANLDFEKVMTPDQSFEILFQNDRLIRYQWKNELDSPGFEKVFLPENHTIIAQRKPKTPFLYSYFLYFFLDHPQGCLLKYIQDFELDAENKPKEEGVLNHLKSSSGRILQGIEKYFTFS